MDDQLAWLDCMGGGHERARFAWDGRILNNCTDDGQGAARKFFLPIPISRPAEGPDTASTRPLLSLPRSLHAQDSNSEHRAPYHHVKRRRERISLQPFGIWMAAGNRATTVVICPELWRLFS